MNDPPEPYDPDKHSAWLASLSPDENLVIHVPVGHQWNMVAASLFKRWLQGKMDAGLRLRLLESLNGMTDIYLRPEMVAMVEPMCDTAYGIWKEAKTLDRDGDKACMASFRVLTSWRVFNHFLTLNPSILAAIKWREEYRGNVARQQTPNPPAAPTSEQTNEHPQPHLPQQMPPLPPPNYPGIPDRFFDRPATQSFPHDFNLHNGT